MKMVCTFDTIIQYNGIDYKRELLMNRIICELEIIYLVESES